VDASLVDWSLSAIKVATATRPEGLVLLHAKRSARSAFGAAFERLELPPEGQRTMELRD
jgi:hypothetical protein